MRQHLLYTSLLILFLTASVGTSQAISSETEIVAFYKPKKKKNCKDKVKVRKKQIKEKAKAIKKAQGKMKSKNKAISTYS